MKIFKKYNILERKDEQGEAFFMIVKYWLFPIKVTTLGSYAIPCFPEKQMAEEFLNQLENK